MAQKYPKCGTEPVEADGLMKSDSTFPTLLPAIVGIFHSLLIHSSFVAVFLALFQATPSFDEY